MIFSPLKKSPFLFQNKINPYYQKNLLKINTFIKKQLNSQNHNKKSQIVVNCKNENQRQNQDYIFYASAIGLTIITYLSITQFKEQIQDIIYGGTFKIISNEISLGDITSVILWSIAYFYISPIQLLFVFLGTFEKERPSDWIIYNIGKILNQPINEKSYIAPKLYTYIAIMICIIGGILTSIFFSKLLGGATWSVSTGVGSCMAAAIFEAGRPLRLTNDQKLELDGIYNDFFEFASKRLQKSGSCHESEVIKAFLFEYPKYKNSEIELNTSSIYNMAKEWAPRLQRTSNGFYKAISLKPRVDPFTGK